MFKQIKILTSLEMKSLFGLNVSLHTNDKKAKRRGVINIVAWGFVFLLLAFYMSILSYGMTALGLGSSVPSYLFLIASIFIFFFGVFKAGNVIFAKNGYEMICSLPLSTSAIITSRFLQMYIADLVTAAVIILPGLAVTAAMVPQSIFFYIFGFLGILFAPLVPLTIATLLGTFVTALTQRMKNKSILQTLFSLVFVLAVMLLPRMITPRGEISEEQLLAIADVISSLIGKIYLPAVWLGDAMSQGKVLGFLLYIGVSLAVFAFMVFISAVNFHRICRRMFVTSAKHNYEMEQLKGKGVLFTLLKKEFKRYFSSSIYVMNTIIGPVLSILLAGAMLFSGADKFFSVLPPSLNAKGVIPALIAMPLCMATTTSCAISLEGRHFWIVKSMPITTKTILDAKLLMNLIIMLPCWAVSEILLMIAVHPTVLEAVWLVLIPLCLMLFAVVVGISINLKLCDLTWKREEAVVKQNFGTFIGGMISPLVSLVFAAVILFIPRGISDIVNCVFCVALFALTAILYRSNNKAELNKL